jgi:HlyD family type I secretion membrane fusion protein
VNMMQGLVPSPAPLPTRPLGDMDDPGRDIRAGGLVALLFFGILLGFAAFVPLDAGVHATGHVAVSGNRQAVQHREGGVVTAIHAREGQRVRAGEVLVEMAAPDLRAMERALTSDYLTLLAQRARLLAERSGSGRLIVPAEYAALPVEDRALAEQALRLQQAQLGARRGSLSAQQSVLGQRTSQLREQQAGYSRQMQSFAEQRRILEDEIRGLKELEARGFASLNRIRALERTQEELRGREAAMAAEISRAREGMGENRMQSLSLQRSSLEEIASELRDTEAKISEVQPRLVSVREQLQRARVRAPASGRVVGVTVFTVGGVVTPGQTLMEIVPEDRRLVIQAQVSPNDADDVFQGQTAQIRFSSVHDRSLPLLTGKVRTMSADSFTDEKSGQSYFRAEIEVGEAELDRVRETLGQGELRAGLPAEVVLPVRKRTALDYLLEPLTVHFWQSLREQ